MMRGVEMDSADTILPVLILRYAPVKEIEESWLPCRPPNIYFTYVNEYTTGTK